jgi:NADH-quinone oxidoreductase subunit M
MTLNQLGLSGAVVQMFSHGILAGLLFAVVGRMVYARTHTRELARLGPMNLNHAIPFAAVAFVLAGMASMGLPGFSGFVAELMIVLGAWHAFPIAAVGVGFGILIGVVYVWRAMQKAFFSESRAALNPSSSPGATVAAGFSPQNPHGPDTLPPISIPERLGAIILIAASVFVGVYPQVLLHIIVPALNGPLFDGLRTGSWQ